MKTEINRGLSIAALVVTFAMLAGQAQTDTGAISGLVTDPSGARIRGALVTAVRVDTQAKFATRSDESGFYACTTLRSGNYLLTVEATGFKKKVISGLILHVEQKAAIDVALEVGQIAEEVTVHSQAPLLNPTDSSLGQVIDNRSIVELPLNGRNYLQLGILVSGLAPALKGRWGDNTAAFAANGLRYTMNNYLLDGVDNNSQILNLQSGGAEMTRPSIDAIQEFKLQTSNFSAEFGRSAGAVVNVITKSGGNSFHGTAYEFHRNAVLDAKNFFDSPARPIPSFIQNQFGATLGGPVVKNKTFFFGSSEQFQQRKGLTYLSSVPTAAQRAGDFGSQPMFDPSSTRPNPNGAGFVRDPLPGNRIPLDRWDPVAARVIRLYPQPNGVGAVNNFTLNPKQTDAADQYDTRLDQRVSSSDTLYGRFSLLDRAAAVPGPLPSPAIGSLVDRNSDQAFSNRTLAIVQTHVFSPRRINEFRFGFNRVQADLRPFVKEPLSQQLGIRGVSSNAKVTGLASFQPAGLAPLGDAAFVPNLQGSRTMQFLDSMSIVKGRHELKFGGDIRFPESSYDSSVRSRGVFNFSGAYTQNPLTRPGTGNALGDFLLGLASNGALANSVAGVLKHRAYQFYAQDDWKISSKLTVNFGARWELVTPFFEKDNRASNFVLEPGDPAFGTLLLSGARGDSVADRALYGFDKNNIAPRLGLAYQVTDKTVIRAAAGIFYSHNELWGVVDRPVSNPPFRSEASFPSDQLTPNLVVGDGFPADALTRTSAAPSLVSFAQNFPSSYTEQWNLSIQRLLSSQFVIEAAYVGSNSIKLPVGRDINQPLPGPGPLPPRRRFPAFGSITRFEPMGTSNYHSLQMKAEKRYSSGLAFLASYTFGKALELYQQRAASPATGRAQNNLDLSTERARTANDVRQRLALSGAYQLPAFAANRVAGAMLAGWEMSCILALQSGLPYTVAVGFDPSNTGLIGTDARPNRLGRGDLPGSERTPNRWFNAADFVVQPANSFGNSGRNILDGPGFVNLDLGLNKRIPLTEKLYLQFRAEAFNLFNTPQFDQPGGGTFETAGRPQIGLPGATAISRTVQPARQIQFGMKLVF